MFTQDLIDLNKLIKKHSEFVVLKIGFKFSWGRDKDLFARSVDESDATVLKKDIGTLIGKENGLELVLFFDSVDGLED